MDFYLILGVERGASSMAVERAYTRLARRYHPDLNPGDSEAEAFYRRATEAYETLRDPARRQEYDAAGAPRVVARAAAVEVEFRGFDFSTPVAGASATFGELFSEVLERPGADAAGGEEKGGDLHGEVALGFEEALRGAVRRLAVTRLDTCAACGGSGLRRAAESRCPHCQGRGSAQWRRGHMVFSKPCGQCRGSGRQHHRPCAACRAAGAAAATEEITIQVPAGVADGARLRVAGKGNAGRGGAPAGDLYITARVGSHRLFGRTGSDLTLSVPIGVHEAALGATVTVPTLDGEAQLRVPAGTQSGARLRLRGLGVPSPAGRARGDLLVEIRIVVPRLADERSRQLLREFARLNAADLRRDLFTREPAP